MSFAIFLLWLVTVPFCVHSHQTEPPQGFTLSCGDADDRMLGVQKFVPDTDFISVGNATALKTPDLLSILSTLRFFPEKSARKYCYTFPVIKGKKYLVKTIYYYGEFDGGEKPPVFDQIIDGTKWCTVNTTEDYAKGLSSYYEIFVAAAGHCLSVCVARTQNTISHPFISAIEVQPLDHSVYNATDFTKYALSTVERSNFGDKTGNMIGFPDDKFDRLWHPFEDNNHIVDSHHNVSSEDFWNMPPLKAFTSSITTSLPRKSLEIMWPPVSLPSSKYYIALYFQDDRSPGPHSWRVFDVVVNGEAFYKGLTVTTKGVTVYGCEQPLFGQTNITLIPKGDVGPVISAGEILQVLPLGGITLPADVVALENLAKAFNNTPSDWKGDPCLPSQNSWTGVACSNDNPARVVNLNLTCMELSGILSESVANLTALQNLWLGGNKIYGSIPNMRSLKKLQTLHLENNQLTGKIPRWLSQLGELHELFLQNNNLDGRVPDALKKKNGLYIQVSPGNRFAES
ncbi:hypothetical protein Pint_34416 [Pistacia integerrima]|uniref:Uncharacterized protein n=1 Tax=Pistacia integerrima TaxID=434235 RepID=A0ACC0X6M0_9ROSI|nr:hypothetical protein Pint_34416 [Pistacia integerrima]